MDNMCYEIRRAEACVGPVRTPTDCGDDDRILPWFMISWLSPFVLICIVLVCCILMQNDDGFYTQRSKDTGVQAEFQTLLL